MPLFNSPLFMVAIFNIPAIAALLLCLINSKPADVHSQKTIKLGLKIGMAKSLGGVLLALFLFARFASMGEYYDEESYATTLFMKKIVSYVSMAAIVDVIYSIIAYFLL